ncbi:MAG: dihydrofolate reductase [Candidatus Wenzhouxiangella sp. M2_3B_020]
MSKTPEIVLVAAMGRNRVIGVDGRMPWHLPADLKHFKSVTMGHPIVMGRRTFESIGRPLPGRRNVVLSRSLDSAPDGVEVQASLDAALGGIDDEAVMIIGGGAVYDEVLPRADRMELTLVDAAPEGDTFFPAYDRHEWALRAMTRRPPDNDNEHALVFCSFVRETERQEFPS